MLPWMPASCGSCMDHQSVVQTLLFIMSVDIGYMVTGMDKVFMQFTHNTASHEVGEVNSHAPPTTPKNLKISFAAT